MIGRSGDYIVDPDSGCWLWQRSLTSGGYGRVQRSGAGGAETTAHRWYFEQAGGVIPRGHHVDHLCRNRACVNPAHLEAVTPAENCRRALGKLNAEDVRRIRWLSRQGFGPTAIASLFPVKQATISNVLSGARWGDIE